MKLIFILALTVSIGLNLHAKSYPFQHYSTLDGLPSNTVYSVYKDRAGYLWFGTDMGVARYNGLKFEIFTTSNGLADNEVFSFQEDADGRLWLATYNGKLCYYKNGHFYSERSDSLLRLPGPTFHITNISIEHDSSVSLSFEGGRYDFVNIRKNDLRIFPVHALYEHRPSRFRKKVGANLYQIFGQKQNYFIDTQMSIVRRGSHRSEDIKYYHGNNNGYLIAKDSIFDADGRFVRHLKRILPMHTEMTMDNFLLGVYNTRSHHFFYTRNGLFLDDSVHLFNDIIVTNIGEDLQGNYWATTYKNGVYKLPKDFDQYVQYQNAYQGRILYTQKFQQKLAYFTSADKNLYSFEAGKRRVVEPRLNYKSLITPIEKWSSFLVIDSDNYAYLTDEYDLLAVKFRKGNHRSTIHTSLVGTLKDIFLSGDELYGADNDRLGVINIRPGQGESSKFHYIFQSSDKNSRILDRHMDPQGNVWFSTNDTLYKIINHLPVAQKDFAGLSFRRFIFFHGYLVGFDNENMLHIFQITGETANEVNIIRPPDNYIWDRLFIIDSTHILISTNKLYQVLTFNNRERDNYFSLRTIENSFLPINPEFLFSDLKNCYFLSNGEIMSVSLEVLFAPAERPRPLFTKFSANNHQYAVKNTICLNQTDAKNIAIDFTGISYNSTDISYQYSIASDSTKTDWIGTTSNTISFPTLNYGKYFIKIRAKSPASDYSNASSIELTVLKPFWLSWWFILTTLSLFVFLLIVLVRGIVRNSLLKRKKEYDANMRYYGAEYKALNALMNPHFIFNSLNNIQGLINRNDKKAANKFLMHFSTLVRQNMQNVSKGTVTLQEELDLIKNYLSLEKMRFDDYVDYTFEIEPEVETEVIRIPPLLIQPLVENAIKHGLLPKQAPHGLVTIRVYERHNDVYIEVIDNGVGYQHHKQPSDITHESFGLANLNKRTAYAHMLHKQNITFSIRETQDENGNFTGTIATLKIDALPSGSNA